MYSATPIFPTVIYETKNPYEFSEEETTFLKTADMHKKLNLGCSDDTHVLELKVFKNLKKFITSHIKTYVYDVLSIDPSIEFYITESWVNYMPVNGHHHQHKHPNSILSGVLFINGDNSPLTLISEETKPFSTLRLNAFKNNLYNTETFLIDNTPGMLVLFPSDLSHAVDVNGGNDIRCSLSFNTFVKGDLFDTQTSRLTLS